ncbi:cupin domain-containing protein [Sphingosinicella sp. BN140058]|uniref:cupin domain-containing protein n=1 Tax=Sphingosinicella sp. BN140058 TaxID=1892855 RepID=UPI0010113B4D|nr:cupin domain-containing protein [Sphingosinicella sp. BN140058]QAY78967.1 cupin domain-containing protein [Sphingosinicella sp. BN140058]
MNKTHAAASLLALLALAQTSAEAQTSQIAGARNAKVTQVYEHSLPGLPGKSVKGVLVEYGPGGSSPSHRHAKSAIIYATVLEGAVRCQINGGPVKTYGVGQNWTELPGDHHGISANASDSQPAKVLAVFVVDDTDSELTIPDRK